MTAKTANTEAPVNKIQLPDENDENDENNVNNPEKGEVLLEPPNIS